MQIDNLLIHRPPFRFVDALVSVSEVDGVFALTLSAGDPRLTDGRLAPLFLVEALAQSAAAFFGAQQAHSAESGFLVELSAVELLADAHANQSVRLRVTKQRQLGAVARFLGEAKHNDALLARATITVARDVHGAGP